MNPTRMQARFDKQQEQFAKQQLRFTKHQMRARAFQKQVKNLSNEALTLELERRMAWAKTLTWVIAIAAIIIYVALALVWFTMVAWLFGQIDDQNIRMVLVILSTVFVLAMGVYWVIATKVRRAARDARLHIEKREPTGFNLFGCDDYLYELERREIAAGSNPV